ncbi:hypothetical protein [Streptomyces sp. NPDC097619]|uniref:hypothetical protein n=1 Tax=Streptomyces sp. NPDC097619 TaxID=3157228 RepID=UPI00332824E1
MHTTPERGPRADEDTGEHEREHEDEPGAGPDVLPRVGAGGGEPACLLHLVCEECGALDPDRAGKVCARCGTPLPDGTTPHTP